MRVTYGPERSNTSHCTRKYPPSLSAAQEPALRQEPRASGPKRCRRALSAHFRGRRAAVVVSAEEWERKTRRSGSLADFFSASPLRASGLSVRRSKDKLRKTDL
jgi:hypothetical protein